MIVDEDESHPGFIISSETFGQWTINSPHQAGPVAEMSFLENLFLRRFNGSSRSCCLCQFSPLQINCVTKSFLWGSGINELVGICWEFERGLEDWKEIFAPGLQTVP